MDKAIDLVMGVLGQQGFYAPLDEGYEQDGLIFCSKCHTPRQMWIDILGDARLVTVLCDCKAAELDAEERADRQRRHQAKLAKWRAQGVSDTKWHGCTFEADDGKDDKASSKCRRYAENFPSMMESDTGLLLYGDVGSGKTFLAACIANSLIDQEYYVMMVNLPSLIASMNAEYGERRDYYMDKIGRADLLILDDFGVERGTEYSIEQVYEIVNARYKTGKPLVVTTNLSMQELRDEPGIGKRRIYDRIVEKCIPLMVRGESRRKAIASEKREKANRILEGEYGK